MAYILLNLAASTTGTLLVTASHRNRALPYWGAVVCTRGAFGGGTLTLAVSPDKGTTLIPLKDENGTAISLTAAGYANIKLEGFSGLNNTPLNVYAVLTGATSPNLNIDVFDNQ